MSAARWIKPNQIALAARLDEINGQIKTLVPELLKLQAQSVQRMAETAILASGGQLPPKEDDNA
jgi:hypothetical protein